MAKTAAKLTTTEIEQAIKAGETAQESRRQIAQPVEKQADSQHSGDPFGGAIAEMHNRIEASFAPDAKFNLPAALLPSRLDNVAYYASRAFGVTALIGGFIGAFALVTAIA